jgi:flagellar FliJ protein
VPKFVFQFESVLRQRQVEEDRCQRAFAKLLRQRLILHTQLRQMQQTITQSRGELRGVLLGAVDMSRVSQFAVYSGQATRQAQQVMMKLAQLERQMESSRSVLLEATKGRRAIELLRDKHLRRWRREQEAREAAQADEMNTQAFARRRLLEART